MRSIHVTLWFASIAVSQLALGIWMITLAVERGGMVKCSTSQKLFLIRSAYSVRGYTVQPLPPLPFDAYHLCIFVRDQTLDLAYASTSLFYGAQESC
jgi:hypothetical protein